MIRIFVIGPGMPHKGGGAQLRAYRHVQFLKSLDGFEAFLVAWNREGENPTNEQSPRVDFPISLWNTCYTSQFRKLAYVKLTLHLAEIALRLSWLFFTQRKRFDIVHVIGSGQWFNLIAILIGRLMGKPVVTEMVGLGADDPLHLNRRSYQEEKQLFPHRPLKYSLFLRANAYVSKCQPITQAFIDAGLPGEAVFQIASAVDTRVFCPPNSKEEKISIRKQLGLQPNDEIVLFVGRICKQKGVHWLIPAIQEAARTKPSLKVLMLGSIMPVDETYAKENFGEIKTRGLSENVHYIGNVPNVDEYLKAADLFLLPTLNEGFSGAILEAMASELAIVTSDIPEIAFSQIKDQKEGVLVPVGATSKLAEVIVMLLDDAKRRKSLGVAARKRVEHEFTFDVIGENYVSMYQTMIREEA